MNTQQKVFMLDVAKNGESTLAAGEVYPVERDMAEYLVNKGKAVKVEFPSLEAKELAAERLVRDYKEMKKHIEEHPQFNDAESMRQYALQQLRAKLSQDMEAAKKDYYAEIDKLEKEVARQALQIDFKPDETAANFIDMAVNQLSFADNVADELELLALKISAMDDNQKLTVLQRFGAIKQAVESRSNSNNKTKVNDLLNGILKELKAVNKTAEIDLKLRQLKALRKSGFAPSYTILQVLENKRARG